MSAELDGCDERGVVRSTFRTLFTARSTGWVTSKPAIFSDTSPRAPCRCSRQACHVGSRSSRQHLSATQLTQRSEP